MSRWNNQPFAGEKWVKKLYRNKRRAHSKTETRLVIDRTFGGDVLYRIGRWTHFNKPVTCTHEEWMKWQRTAKQVT
jgi:hypothetical protein